MKTKNIKPWFRFMYRDYLESERVMDISCAAEGIYTRCLALQAIHGTIPADLKKLAKLMRRELSEIEPYWPEVAQFFQPDPEDVTRLYNETQRKLMTQDGNYSEGSKKGHETRKKSQENPNVGSAENPNLGFLDTHKQTQPSRTGARTHASASVSVSESASESVSASGDEEERAGAAKAEPPPEPPTDAKAAEKAELDRLKRLAAARASQLFEQKFWPAWPSPRKNKQEAQKAWLKLCPDERLTERIIAGLEKDKRSDQWRRGVRPHPSTWINQSRWTDEHEDEDPPETAAPTPTDGGPPDNLPEFDPLQPELWTNALYQLHIDDPDGTDTWIKPLSPLGRAGDEIWIAAQDKFTRDMVRSNYRDRLTTILNSEVRIIALPERPTA